MVSAAVACKSITRSTVDYGTYSRALRAHPSHDSIRDTVGLSSSFLLATYNVHHTKLQSRTSYFRPVSARGCRTSGTAGSVSRSSITVQSKINRSKLRNKWSLVLRQLHAYHGCTRPLPHVPFLSPGEAVSRISRFQGKGGEVAGAGGGNHITGARRHRVSTVLPKIRG